MPTTTNEPQAEQLPRIITAGLIASVLKVSRDRVDHVLKTRPHIMHRYRVGNTRIRLFDADVIAMVRYELSRIDARRDQARSLDEDDDQTAFPFAQAEGAPE